MPEPPRLPADVARATSAGVLGGQPVMTRRQTVDLAARLDGLGLHDEAERVLSARQRAEPLPSPAR